MARVKGASHGAHHSLPGVSRDAEDFPPYFPPAPTSRFSWVGRPSSLSWPPALPWRGAPKLYKHIEDDRLPDTAATKSDLELGRDCVEIGEIAAQAAAEADLSLIQAPSRPPSSLRSRPSSRTPSGEGASRVEPVEVIRQRSKQVAEMVQQAEADRAHEMIGVP